MQWRVYGADGLQPLKAGAVVIFKITLVRQSRLELTTAQNPREQ